MKHTWLSIAALVATTLSIAANFYMEHVYITTYLTIWVNGIIFYQLLDDFNHRRAKQVIREQDELIQALLRKNVENFGISLKILKEKEVKND